MIAPLALHDADPELEAALALRATRHLHVRATGERARRLEAAGFARAPHWIEMITEVPLDLRRLSRNGRKSVGRSLEAWRAAGLSLSLGTADSFGIDRLVRDAYYPIVVPEVYTRGVNPHGSHRLDQFVALARRSVVALVEAGDAVVGLALLRIADLTGARHIAGEPMDGRGLEGLLYALRPEIADARRAFMVALADATARRGGRYLSLGKDHPWSEPAYAGVLAQKLGLTASLYAHDGEPGHFYRWNEALLGPGEAIWFAPWRSGRLDLHTLGAADPRLRAWVDRWTEAVSRPIRTEQRRGVA